MIRELLTFEKRVYGVVPVNPFVIVTVTATRCVLTSRIRAPTYQGTMRRSEANALSLRCTEFRAGCLTEPLLIPGVHELSDGCFQRGYYDILSYLDFRPWGIFSTGTHAANGNTVTPPIEALVSTYRERWITKVAPSCPPSTESLPMNFRGKRNSHRPCSKLILFAYRSLEPLVRSVERFFFHPLHMKSRCVDTWDAHFRR